MERKLGRQLFWKYHNNGLIKRIICNDAPQPVGEFQVSFPLMLLKAHLFWFILVLKKRMLT